MEKPKILIVDDEIDVADALRYILGAEYEAEIKIALNGFEAIKILETWQPDLLTTCIMMLGMDGFELIKTIHEKGNYHFPIIIISSMPGAEDIAKGFELGIKDYIIKPCTPEDLIKRVNKVMGRET